MTPFPSRRSFFGAMLAVTAARCSFRSKPVKKEIRVHHGLSWTKERGVDVTVHSDVAVPERDWVPIEIRIMSSSELERRGWQSKVCIAEKALGACGGRLLSMPCGEGYSTDRICFAHASTWRVA